MKFLVFIASLVLSFHLMAGKVTDLYGDESDKGQEIIRKYAKKISEFDSFLEAYLKHPNSFDEEKLTERRNKLIEDIKKDGDYLYVKLSTTLYPQNKNKYITIDVIRKDQPERLRFASLTPTKAFKSKQDLINEMIIFEDTAMTIMFNTSSTDDPCPVYHCIHNFQHPKLKPYLAKFNNGAVKQRQLIIDTLNSDPDPQRRAAAAFLIGHFKNPKEIVALLKPHVHDKDSGVRNDCIRVIAGTMATAKITNIDVKPFLELLDSPETTDRNKALVVLLYAAESENAKQIIKQQGGKNLLAILKLKQPNNHDVAYRILQKISGKNYGETDYAAWKVWLDTTAA